MIPSAKPRLAAISPRRNHGQAISVLALVLGVLVVGALGFLTVEIVRMNIAREQLTAACDIAALAAAQEQAIPGHNKYSQAASLGGALEAFKQCDVLGESLIESERVNSAAELDSVEPLHGKIFVEKAGEGWRVTGTFGLMPMSGKFLPIGQANITTVSTAGIPKLDIIICFDVSGSMDDATKVTFVKRFWDPSGPDRSQGGANTGCVRYEIARAGKAAGVLAEILQPPPVGTSVNALPPQNLDTASLPDQAQDPMNFDDVLRGTSNSGSPPGNKSDPAMDISGPNKFTDLVVNFDDSDPLVQNTGVGLSFPNLAALVEASRGNLNDADKFHSSGADTVVTVSPNSSYQAEYERIAKYRVYPMSFARSCLYGFTAALRDSTDAHFGFVAFSDPAEDPLLNIAQNYPQGGTYPTSPPRCPVIPLSKSSSNYDELESISDQVNVLGLTDVGAALSQAIDQLKNNNRPGAKQAIVLVTDGQPANISGDQEQAEQDAKNAAVTAKDAGIPIFTIAITQSEDSEFRAGQHGILREIANTSGGQFFGPGPGQQSVIKAAFQKIALRLVGLVR